MNEDRIEGSPFFRMPTGDWGDISSELHGELAGLCGDVEDRSPAEVAMRLSDLANRLFEQLSGDERDVRQVISTLRTGYAVAWDFTTRCRPPASASRTTWRAAPEHRLVRERPERAAARQESRLAGPLQVPLDRIAVDHPADAGLVAQVDVAVLDDERRDGRRARGLAAGSTCRPRRSAPSAARRRSAGRRARCRGAPSAGGGRPRTRRSSATRCSRRSTGSAWHDVAAHAPRAVAEAPAGRHVLAGRDRHVERAGDLGAAA